MMTKYSVNKVRRGLYRVDRSLHGYQMGHSAESVDNDQNTRSILTIGRKPEDEVHRN